MTRNDKDDNTARVVGTISPLSDIGRVSFDVFVQ